MALKTMNDKEIKLVAAGVVTIGIKNVFFGSKTIIYDILLWCNVKDLTLLYLHCVYGSRNIECLFVWINVNF